VESDAIDLDIGTRREKVRKYEIMLGGNIMYGGGTKKENSTKNVEGKESPSEEKDKNGGAKEVDRGSWGERTEGGLADA